jgi:hypothetical protein
MILIYGSPGSGKTTLACSTQSSAILLVDEVLTGIPWEVPHPDEPPRNFRELLIQIRELSAHARKAGLKHLVIDKMLGVERLVYELACEQMDRSYSDAVDYGKLWKTALPLWRDLVREMDTARSYGTNVWLLADSTEETASDPETGKTWRRLTVALEGTADTRRELTNLLVGRFDHVLCLVRDVTLRKAERGARPTARIGDRELWTSDALGGAVAKNRGGLPPVINGTWIALRDALVAAAKRTAASPEPPAAPAEAEPAPEAHPAPAEQPKAEPAPKPAPIHPETRDLRDAMHEGKAAAATHAEPQKQEPEQGPSFAERLAGADMKTAGAMADDARERGHVEDLTAAYVRALSIAASTEELEYVARSCKAEALFKDMDRQRPKACGDAFTKRSGELKGKAA